MSGITSSLKQLVLKLPLSEYVLRYLRGSALDRQYAGAVSDFRHGSCDPAVHLERFRAQWAPRRRIADASALRVALICMETWESRSLIPGIVDSFDAVHIAISDTSDFKFYTAQQERVVSEFLEMDADRPFDLVLVYGTNAQVSAGTLAAIRARGPLVAVMCLDDKQSFEDVKPQRSWPGGQRPLIGHAHVHLTSARECLRWYDCHGASAFYWPEAANPLFGLHGELEKDIDVSFVGQSYGERKSFVEALRRCGIKMSCFGAGWENPFVSDEEMFRIFARSKINLGMGYVGYSQNLTCLKGRDFDVPGSGNFYLTTYDNELAKCFEIGKEIACYRNIVECAEMIRYFLETPGESKQIAAAGRARVLRDHTWAHRVRSLVRWTGIELA